MLFEQQIRKRRDKVVKPQWLRGVDAIGHDVSRDSSFADGLPLLRRRLHSCLDLTQSRSRAPPARGRMSGRGGGSGVFGGAAQMLGRVRGRAAARGSGSR
jgi:hypothetical protein